MTLRGDAVNILNKPVWGDPNLDINSGKLRAHHNSYRSAEHNDQRSHRFLN